MRASVSILVHLAILGVAVGAYLCLGGLTGMLVAALIALVGVQAVQVWRRERRLRRRPPGPEEPPGEDRDESEG